MHPAVGIVFGILALTLLTLVLDKIIQRSKTRRLIAALTPYVVTDVSELFSPDAASQDVLQNVLLSEQEREQEAEGKPKTIGFGEDEGIGPPLSDVEQS